MTSEFDWRTEEEDGWEEDSLAKPIARHQPFALNRRYILLLVLALVLVLVGLLLYAEKRADERTRLLEADVLATHQILIQAAENRDIDRFETLVSAEPIAWKSLQVELFRNDQIISRRPLGLGDPSDKSVEESISSSQVELSRRLDSAEVRSTFPYEYIQADSITQTVYLERIFSYKLDDTSWMLTDVDEPGDFWGPWHRISGDVSTIVFPERDTEIGTRLAGEFNAFLANICMEPEVSCPNDFHLTIRLGISESSLLRLNEGVFNNRILVGYGPETLELPTPTLVGQPVDEAGYEALSQAYKSWIAAIMITNFPEEGITIDEEVLDTSLAALGLMPIPPPIQALPFRSRITFPADIAPPNQDLMLLCSDSELMLLLHYDMVGGEWDLGSYRSFDPTYFEFSGYPAGMLTRLIDYSGAVYILRELIGEESVWRLYLWQAGIEELMIESDEPSIFWPPIVQPGTNSVPKRLVVYRVNVTDSGDNPEYWYINLEDCSNDTCQFELLDLIPIWSPDGNYSLVMKPLSNGQLEIYRGNVENEDQIYLGVGHSLNWVNNDSYSYVLEGLSPDVVGTSNSNEDALIKVQISFESDEEMDIVEWTLTAEQLREEIPEVERPVRLTIKRASTAGEYEGEWYILATNSNDSPNGTAYLFRYDENENTIDLVETYFGQVFGYSSASGINRDHFGFVVFDGRSLRYMMFDSREDVVKQLGDILPYDQSADGDWLVFIDGNKLKIASLVGDFEWTLEHGLDSCNAAVWINRD